MASRQTPGTEAASVASESFADDATVLPAGGVNALGVTLGLLGDEWNLWIVRGALNGRKRYSEWAAEGQISHAVLTARLTTLTSHGIFERVPYQDNPIRYEYRLTRRGASLWPVLVTMWAWEARWSPRPDAPLPLMVHRVCGYEFSPTLHCRECHQIIVLDTLVPIVGPSGAFSRSVPDATSRRRSSTPARQLGLLPHTMELIGNRWSASIIGAAFRGANRYRDFLDITGAPPTIVADRLRRLTDMGVMTMVPMPDRPQWSTYRLTPQGLAFFPVISSMMDWGQRWFRAADGFAIISQHTTCDRVFRPELRCGQCGDELHSADIEIVEQAGAET